MINHLQQIAGDGAASGMPAYTLIQYSPCKVQATEEFPPGCE
jgi:hypothetical protein